MNRPVPTPRSEPDMTSWALVEAAKAGDTAAFGQLYERYRIPVYRFLMTKTSGDHCLAEDLTSDVFVRALRGIGSVNYQGREVGAWLTTIARNRFLDHVKCSRYRLETVTDDIREGDPVRGPEDEVIGRDVSARVRSCVARLNDVQRQAVTLRHLDCRPVSEVADVMGCPVANAKARTHRGLVSLRSMPVLQALV